MAVYSPALTIFDEISQFKQQQTFPSLFKKARRLAQKLTMSTYCELTPVDMGVASRVESILLSATHPQVEFVTFEVHLFKST